MAGIELKIDDDYINGMASLFEIRSLDLQECVDRLFDNISRNQRRGNTGR